MKIDVDVEPIVEEDEPPPRVSLRRVIRWVVVVSVATVGIMTVLTILPEPL
jgi:hypothetical protein